MTFFWVQASLTTPGNYGKRLWYLILMWAITSGT